MPYNIVIPRLGLTMTTGRLVEWLKKNGEKVEKGEALFTIETDKALQEVEAPANGIVYHRPGIHEGDLPIGTLIGCIGEPDEEIVWPETEYYNGPEKMAEVIPSESSDLTSTKSSVDRRASPAARRLASDLGLNLDNIPGSSREGHILLSDVLDASGKMARISRKDAIKPKVRLSPLAKRLAEEQGIDLTKLAEKYPGKRLTREDVERAVVEKDLYPSTSRTKFTHVRKLIAERLMHSVHDTAPVTLTTEADATEIVKMRSQLSSDTLLADKSLPTYTDILIKLVAEALEEHPMLNSRLENEDVIVFSEYKNIGIAVDTDRGLLVPVLHDVQDKNLIQIAEESALLINNAHTNNLNPDMLKGGTFTITNLGMHEIDAFTPIINMPECAILGLGRIIPKQIVLSAENEKTAIRHMMKLSLTFDHRLVDGAPAARFLQRIKQFVEKPYIWLTKE